MIEISSISQATHKMHFVLMQRTSREASAREENNESAWETQINSELASGHRDGVRPIISLDLALRNRTKSKFLGRHWRILRTSCQKPPDLQL